MLQWATAIVASYSFELGNDKMQVRSSMPVAFGTTADHLAVDSLCLAAGLPRRRLLCAPMLH